MLASNQVFVVVDIETDGPVPGLYSMLSLAAVATTEESEVGSYYQKILPLEGASQDPLTMKWWGSHPEMWQEATTAAQPAEKVMKELCSWLDTLEKQPIFVAHPVGFDFSFVSWYLTKFAHANPFTNNRGAPITLDLPSFIAGKLGLSLHDSTRERLPARLRENMPEHSHNALEDARGFSVILRNALL